MSRDTAQQDTESSDLVKRCKEGDRAAFERLIRRYERYVLNVIFHITGGIDEAEDVAQEVFLRVYRSIKRFRGESSFESWIYKITLNCCRTFSRRRGLIRSREIDLNYLEQGGESRLEILSNLPDIKEDPETHYRHRKILEELMRALGIIPPIYREVIVMREMNELSYEEMSRIIGINIGTVKSRLNRAREMLRKMVEL